MKKLLRSFVNLIVIFTLLTTFSVTSFAQIQWYTEKTGTEDFIYDIAGKSGKLAAVSKGGNILTSAGKGEWVLQKVTNEELRGIVWNGKKFVAVGGASCIYTSMDGAKWSKASVPGKYNFEDVAWSGKEFAAVSGGGVICTSKDGAKWTLAKSGIKKDLLKVIWDGRRFVAVGPFNALVISSDGISWTALKSNDLFISIVYFKNKYVAVGVNGSIKYSQDLKTWKESKSGTTEHLTDVLWNGKGYVVVGNRGIVLESKDALKWEKASVGTDADLSKIEVIADKTYIAGGQGLIVVKGEKPIEKLSAYTLKGKVKGKLYDTMNLKNSKLLLYKAEKNGIKMVINNGVLGFKSSDKVAEIAAPKDGKFEFKLNDLKAGYYAILLDNGESMGVIHTGIEVPEGVKIPYVLDCGEIDMDSN